jgi:hypothetical protein
MTCHAHQNVVAYVDDLNEIEAVVLPLIGPVLPGLSDRGTALIALGVGNLGRLNDHQIRRGPLLKQAQLASLQRLEPTLYEIHVLLRPRPCSIPQAQGASL